MSGTTEIAHWKMNDDAATTVVVDAQGSHDGVAARNTDAFNSAGKVNGALDFNGTSDLSTTVSAAELNFTDGAGNDDPFSICAWVNMDDATGFRMLSKYDNGTVNMREYWVGTNAADKQVLQISDIDGDTIFMLADSAITGDQGSYIHLAFTYDGSNANTGMTLYRNGVAVAATGGSSGGAYGGMPSTAQVLLLGALDNSPGTIFGNGDIDDVRIFDIELTLAQVGLIYNGGTGTETSLAVLEDQGESVGAYEHQPFASPYEVGAWR